MMPETLKERLTRKLEFPEADLLANRQGELSERQQELLRAKRRQYLRNGGLTSLVMWLVFSAALVGSVLAQGAQPQDMAVLPFGVGGITALFGSAWLFSQFRGRHLIKGRVSTVEGPAQTKVARYRTRFGVVTAYELRVGKRLFRMASEQELASFERGKIYRIYFVEYAPLHVLLSAEPLEN